MTKDEASHTHGPWVYERCPDKRRDGFIRPVTANESGLRPAIARTCLGMGGAQSAYRNRAANGALIAQAPAMLAVIKMAAELNNGAVAHIGAAAREILDAISSAGKSTC